MEGYRRWAEQLSRFLTEYKWLLDTYVIEFFTEDHWSKLPPSWQGSLRGAELTQLSQLLLTSPYNPQRVTTTVPRVYPLSLLAFVATAHALSVPRQPRARGGRREGEFCGTVAAKHSSPLSQIEGLDHVFRRHLKPKKQHEIKELGQEVMRLSKITNCKNIIDVGSGQGHLARYLSFCCGLHVVTVDAVGCHLTAAAKFDSEVERDLQKSRKLKMKGDSNHGDHERGRGSVTHVESVIQADATIEEFLSQLGLSDAESREAGLPGTRFILVGLHTCGDLASTMLRVYSQSRQVVGVVSVGCCYMKLTCEETHYSDSYQTTVDKSSTPLSNTPLSSAPLTTAPLSNAPLSSTPLSTAPLSSTLLSTAPLSNAPLSSASLSNAPLSNAPLSTAPLSTAPLSNAPLSSASLSNAPLSNAPLSPAPLSSAPLSVSPGRDVTCSTLSRATACAQKEQARPTLRSEEVVAQRDKTSACLEEHRPTHTPPGPVASPELLCLPDRGGRVFGYPLSQFVAQLPAPRGRLSYEAREVACHSMEAYRERLREGSHHLKVHCHRAVVETILRKHGMRRSQVKISRRVSKLPFTEYATAVLEALGLPPSELHSVAPSSRERLLAQWPEVVVFFMLRLAAAPCAESLVLLDRVLYLMEQGLDTELLAAFEPTLSPRNITIVSHK